MSNESIITARKYLRQGYWLDKRINSKLRQLSLLRSNAITITANLNDVRVQTSRNNSKMEDTILKIIEKENEIDNEVERLICLKNEISEAIDKIPSIEHRLVLELRYLCFLSWEQIAVEMNYSIDYVYKLHRKALEMLQVPQ